MAAVGSLVVDLIANTASFNSNIEKAASTLNSNAAKMQRSLKGIEEGIKSVKEVGATLAEALAVREVAEAVKGALEFGAAMKIQADQIGITAEQLQVLHLAGKMVGTTQDEVDIGLKRLTVSLGKAELGAKSQQTVFKALGVDYHKTAAEALPQFMDGLAKVGDASKRHALEVLEMGRSAVALDPLLRKGAAGLDALKKSAEEAGLILSDKLTEQAHEAAVQIELLTTKLKVSWAAEVAQNANSIISLATALNQLVISGLNLVTKYPRIVGAIAGIAAGSRAGLPGMILGAAGGVLAGNYVAGQQADSNMDIGFRLHALNVARATVENKLRPDNSIGGLFKLHEGNSSVSIKEADTELNRQRGLLRQAMAAKQIEAVMALPPDGIGNLLGGKAPHAKKDPLADAAERFGQERDQIAAQILEVQKSNLTDVDAIAGIDKQVVIKEQSRADLAIQKEVNDKHIHDYQGAELIAMQASLAAVKQEKIDRDALAEKIQRTADLQTGLISNQLGTLSLQEQFAQADGQTATQRLTIGLQILALQKEQARIEAQKTLDLAADGKATAEAAQQAQDTLKHLDTNFNLQAQILREGAKSPLQAYQDSIDRTPAQMNDALQSVTVSGLTNFTDQLADAIVNFKSLGAVAKSVLSGIATDLLRMEIQKYITLPIAKALKIGPSSSSNIGGDTTGLEGNFDKAFGSSGLTAAGTSLTSAGTTLTTSGTALTTAATALQAAATQLATTASTSGVTGGGGGLGGIGSLLSGGGSSIFGISGGVDLGSTAALDFAFGDGGAVTGPGGPTSDSIHARLSDGEFVLNAKAVKQIGIGNLNMLNKGTAPRFAAGGYVGRMPALTPRNDNNSMPPVTIHVHGAASEREARQTGRQAASAFNNEVAKSRRAGIAG